MANGGWVSRADIKEPLKTAFRTQVGGLKSQVQAGTLPRADAMTQAAALRERLRTQLRQQLSLPRPVRPPGIIRPLPGERPVRPPIHTLPVR